MSKKFITIMVVILIMIIDRPLERRALQGKDWVLVYGRRKTGKTFLVENFVDYHEFFFVKRDGSILEKSTWENIEYSTFKRILRTYLENEKTVVVDEFHRLGGDFLDFVHALPKKGRLILISSTLHTSKMLISAKSPLLGRFAEIRVPLINMGDALLSLRSYQGSNKELGEMALMMREPILIDAVESGNMWEIPERFSLTVSALIGEVFSEEDRKMSRTYEGIIRGTASGKSTSGEISSFLYSRKLISRDDPSIIQQYLNNLVNIGILQKIPVWGKKRMVYQHTSPLTGIFYYLDEKYGISDRRLSKTEIERLASEIMPHLMEQHIRDFIGFLLGMRVYVHQNPDFEVDGILTSFKRPEIVLEIKWKKQVDKEDIKKAERNMKKIDVKRRILIIPDKKELGFNLSGIEIMDISDLMAIYEGRKERREKKRPLPGHPKNSNAKPSR